MKTKLVWRLFRGTFFGLIPRHSLPLPQQQQPAAAAAPCWLLRVAYMPSLSCFVTLFRQVLSLLGRTLW